MATEATRMEKRVSGEVLTPKEVAAILGLSERSVIRHMANGELPGRKVGVVWRVRRDIFEQHMAGNQLAA